MIKKNGFTLGEVLLSLGIVGVLAAVVLPSLMLNVERSKVGPSLMKAVNTLESSAALALQMTSARKLTDIKKGSEDNLPLISGILVDYTRLIPISYNPQTGTKLTGTAYATKDGIVFLENGEAKPYGDAHGAKVVCYKVNVDINASRGPNKVGRDLFTLYVLSDGTVAPQGSFLYDKHFGGGTWETKCKSVTKEDKSKPESAEYCAGSITDNGGRVLYNYEITE